MKYCRLITLTLLCAFLCTIFDGYTSFSANALPPNPGPFKLVSKTVGGAQRELWQARGQLGKFGGTFTVSTFGSGPKTFNYWCANDVESGGIGLLMFDGLVDLDPWTGKFYPCLAKSFSISPDKRCYIFTLRKSLCWSDGHPLTADDVEFTLNSVVGKGLGNQSLRDTISVDGKFPKVEKVDALTIKFTTEKPFAPFLSGLAAIRIAPKHIFETVCKQPPNAFQSFWDIHTSPENIIVSGPFKLLRYVPGQRVELARNPNFSMVDKAGHQLPYLDKFVDAIVPDQGTQILKFLGNELDMLDIRSVPGLYAHQLKQKEQTNHFKLYNLGPDDGTTFLIFNMNRRKDPHTGKYYVDPIKQKWFNNVYFRQAVTHAIDRQRIVNNVLRGVGLPLFGPESTASLYFDKTLKPYSQDLAYAATLLTKGGFKKQGDRLVDADGHPVEFTLNTNAGNNQRDATCIIIVNSLKQLGIKVNYQPIDFHILVDKTSQSLSWESVVMGLSGSKIEPYEGANVWKSEGRLHMFDQRLPDKKGQTHVTDARDWEKEIDSCFNLGATTLDSQSRHKYFDRYQKIVYQQLPFIYLYSILDLTAVKDNVENYMPTPLGISYTPKGSLHNIEEIYLK